MKFCFVIPSYNNSLNVKRNLESVIRQTYTNWHAIYINDCSTDGTHDLFFEIVKQYNVESKFTYIKNDRQMGQMYNKYIAYKLVGDFEIVCILDGDDWLNGNNVLTSLFKVYSDPSISAATSNYMLYSNKILSEVRRDPKYTYSQNHFTNKSWRTTRIWGFDHLKTCYGIYLKSIPEEYLKYDEKWLTMSTDIAEIFAAFELTKGKCIIIDEFLYVYNKDNSIQYENSFFKTAGSELRLTSLKHIFNLPKCKYSLPFIYVINMLKDTEKRKNMETQLHHISHTNFKFIEAVEGKSDNDNSNYIKLYYEYMGIRNTSDEILFNKSCIEDKYKEEYNYKKQHITKGSLGLIQSVFKLLNDFINSTTYEHITIFEDDAFALKEFDKNFYINEELLKNKDLLYLGCHNAAGNMYLNTDKSSNIFIDISKNKFLIYGTYSIIISRKLGKYILDLGIDKILRLNVSWDLLLNYIRNTNTSFTYYLYFKQLFIPNVTNTDCINSRLNPFGFYNKKNISIQDYLPFFKINIFQFWDKGVEHMPSMIRYIYNYNLKQSQKYDFKLILITDNNVKEYINPHSKFFNLAPNFKSDIVRYYVLDKYGGIWLDTDIIIIKNLNILYNSIISSNYDTYVDSEYINNSGIERLGCASLVMKSNSTISNYCVNYINNYLDSDKPLIWGEIGPIVIEEAYKTHTKYIKLNKSEFTNKGCNFIQWIENPGYNKDSWIRKTSLDAYNISQKLLNNSDCFYVITWTIYRKNDITSDINNFVFNNPHSVFTYLIKNYEIPTFNVLIATVGRPGLQNMLNSLSPQLSERDCLTVVFDGKSKIPSDFDFSKFKCKINLFNEPIALKYWGHGIRNKYASLLEKRDFIMHADDDDTYTSNAFDTIRSTIIDINTLYIFKFFYNNNPFPTKHEIKEGNIGTPMGIIPYELNNKGEWLHRYGGDGAFYEQIARNATNIVFCNEIIYILRPNEIQAPKITNPEPIKITLNTKNIEFIPNEKNKPINVTPIEKNKPINVTPVQQAKKDDRILMNTNKIGGLPQLTVEYGEKQFTLKDFVKSLGVKPFSSKKIQSENEDSFSQFKSGEKLDFLIIKNKTFNPEGFEEQKEINVGVVPKTKPINNIDFEVDSNEEDIVEPIKIKYTNNSKVNNVEFTPQLKKKSADYKDTYNVIESFLKLLNNENINRNELIPKQNHIVKPVDKSIFSFQHTNINNRIETTPTQPQIIKPVDKSIFSSHIEPIKIKPFNPDTEQIFESQYDKIEFKVDNSHIHNATFIPAAIDIVDEPIPDSDSTVTVINTNKIDFIPKPVIPVIKKTISEEDSRKIVLNTVSTGFTPNEDLNMVNKEELRSVPVFNTVSKHFTPTFDNSEEVVVNTSNYDLKVNTSKINFSIIPQSEEKVEQIEETINFAPHTNVAFVPKLIDKTKIVDNAKVAIILHGKIEDLNNRIYDFIKTLIIKFKINIFIQLWSENTSLIIDKVKEHFKELAITKIILEDPASIEMNETKGKLKKFWYGQVKIINSINEAQYKTILSLRMDYFSLASRYIHSQEEICLMIEKSLESNKIFLNFQVPTKGLDNMYCGNTRAIKSLIDSLNEHIASSETKYERFLISKVEELNKPIILSQPHKEIKQRMIVLPHAMVSKK